MDLSLMAISNETMGLIIDLVIIGIIVIFAIKGIVNGFVESVLKAIGTFGAVAAGVFGAKPLLELINGLVNISNIFAGMISSYLSGKYPVLQQTITETNMEAIKSDIEGLQIFSTLKNFMLDIVGKGEVGQTVADVISAPIGYIVAVIIVAIVIFILVKLIVFFLSKLFQEKDRERGGKSGTDKTLGLFLGTAKGLVIVVGIYFIVSLATYIPVVSSTLTPYINETHIVKPTYQYVEKQVDKAIINNDWSEVIKKIAKNPESGESGEEEPIDTNE